MAFNIMTVEIGECYVGATAQLRLEFKRSRVGAWEVELSEVGGRRISHRYDDEPTARAAAEAAYEYGRQMGRWRIQRAMGYEPTGQVSPLGWEPNESDQSAPSATQNGALHEIA